MVGLGEAAVGWFAGATVPGAAFGAGDGCFKGAAAGQAAYYVVDSMYGDKITAHLSDFLYTLHSKGYDPSIEESRFKSIFELNSEIQEFAPNTFQGGVRLEPERIDDPYDPNEIHYISRP